MLVMANEEQALGQPVFGLDSNPEHGKSVLRVIKTARGIDAINAGAAEGLRPLVKKVEQSTELCMSMVVYQHEDTGEVFADLDPRSEIPPGYTQVLPHFAYYPDPPKHPVAAYLIPDDLKAGERVLLEDLIEDVLKSIVLENVYRLQSCEATWDGSEFELHAPKQTWVVG